MYVCMYVYIYIYICHNIFIHSSFDGHLSCFPALANVNSAAVNTGVHVPFELWLSQIVCPVGFCAAKETINKIKRQC